MTGHGKVGTEGPSRSSHAGFRDGAVRMVDTDEDLHACFPTLAQLRPHLSESAFVEQARRQIQGGYRLVLLEEDGAVRAVAGFRLTETLFSGKHLYVDDLVTNEADRSRGFGARLVAWLVEHARAGGCRTLELDSGVQRRDAHRFYFREGMHVSSFHFRTILDGVKELS